VNSVHFPLQQAQILEKRTYDVSCYWLKREVSRPDVFLKSDRTFPLKPHSSLKNAMKSGSKTPLTPESKNWPMK
jgi:hypothetical protein